MRHFEVPEPLLRTVVVGASKEAPGAGSSWYRFLSLFATTDWSSVRVTFREAMRRQRSWMAGQVGFTDKKLGGRKIRTSGCICRACMKIVDVSMSEEKIDSIQTKINSRVTTLSFLMVDQSNIS